MEPEDKEEGSKAEHRRTNECCAICLSEDRDGWLQGKRSSGSVCLRGTQGVTYRLLIFERIRFLVLGHRGTLALLV
jgi:hypothetical protein